MFMRHLSLRQLVPSWLTRERSKLLAAGLTLCATAGLAGCANTRLSSVEIDTPLGSVRFEFIQIESCGNGAVSLGYMIYEGKVYRGYDTDGDGLADCATDNKTGTAYAATVIEGDPANITWHRTPAAARQAATQPSEGKLPPLGPVETEYLERLEDHELTWTDTIATGSFMINSLEANSDAQSALIDIQFGVAHGTSMAPPSFFGLEWTSTKASYGPNEDGAVKIRMMRLRGDAVDFYRWLNASFGVDTVALDFSYQTENYGHWEFDGTYGSEIGLEHDSNILEVSWNGVPFISERF